ncbi:hypothetical protein [Agrococcus sp. TF02-05]|uniref:hypothetical protein n=1 Tax=Agrococcus sp. TF02-05 TaxID=2815211 RepID=UPI001AA1B279|nr:hypothetical protein [Agrococcus sp. TF02-05]MBO1770452.1 hypothetical protein [Agrococcus sp. TF02-05]
MPAGYIDPDSGQYIYGSDDPRQPMHDVLNLGQQAAATESQQTRSRLDQLELWLGGFNAATPWANLPLNSTYFEVANTDSIAGVASTPLRYRRAGDRLHLIGTVNAKAVPPNWTVLGTLPSGFRPIEDTPILYMFNLQSDITRGVIKTNGDVQLSWAPTTVNADLTIVFAEALLV